MDDSTSWRNDGKVIEGSGSPLEELKSLIISLKLNLLIMFPCVLNSSHINLHTVVDD